ncbi:hypothetical protein [Marinobacter sp. Arc7-DN-1]|uniref:hypothetical protein n=1 Tax=Marinobacter sp. Arc7-DN-1 TaxID=2304594 RepID=UPI000E44D55B|nr:hypothetical protein [Marinobacter sp. Arc7-DN-1]AXS81904.1 hypothetical protein D0851_01910 [Marinobacter sp. Arc7-DN-1]
MKFKRKTKQYIKFVVVDIIIVLAAGFSFIGVSALAGADLSKGDYIRDVTPLFLGGFSVIVAFTLLKINIDENRKQAKRDRDLQVRPVVTLRVVDGDQLGKNLEKLEMYCPLESEEENEFKSFFLEAENFGQGPALEVILIFVSDPLDQDFLASGGIESIKVNEKVAAHVEMEMPNGFSEQIISVCSDIYGHRHFGFHTLWLDDDLNIYVLSNSYQEYGEWFFKRDMFKTMMSIPCSKENVSGSLA